MMRRSVLIIAIVVAASLAVTAGGAVGTAFAFERVLEIPPAMPSLAKPQIPKEPGWNQPSYRGWELLGIPGLLGTYYDLALKGTLDYMVIRKILRKTSSEEITIDEAIAAAKADNMSVYISNPVIYFTSKYPLFYCVGLDYQHNCRDMWVDIAEDGLNGNEVLYSLSTPTPDVR